MIYRDRGSGGWGGGWLEVRLKRKGTCVYLELIHLTVQQKLTQHCKAMIFQLKINFLKKEGGSDPCFPWKDMIGLFERFCGLVGKLESTSRDKQEQCLVPLMRRAVWPEDLICGIQVGIRACC